MNQLPIFPDHCTGCSACAAVCPQHAIALAADPEGFAYPRVEASLCVLCGQCLSICPVLHAPPVGTEDPVAVAAVSRDDDLRASSSSGGIFGVLAQQILAEGGIVAGAAWDEHFQLGHIVIDDMADLALLQGSKYVQSNMGDILRRLRDALADGQPVLFTGTPCQTAGVRAFLGSHNLLYCVDLICHGVPSPKAWAAYVRELRNQYNSALQSVSFRSKSAGWRRSALRIEFVDGQIYEVPHGKDPYMWLFLKDMILRPSCYNCPFRGLRRCSDLTLADLWGAEESAPELDDNQGVSLVLLHSEMGKAVWDRIAHRLRTQPVDLMLAKKGNPSLDASPVRPAQRESCFALLDNTRFSNIVQHAINKNQQASSAWTDRLRRWIRGQ